MPPTRRNNSTPQPTGRRPKIAGQQAARRPKPTEGNAADRPVADLPATEPATTEPATTEPATTEPAASQAPKADPPNAHPGAVTPATASPDALSEPSGEPGSVDAGADGTAARDAAAPGRPVNRTSALRPRQRSADDAGIRESGDPAAERRGWRRVVVIGGAALALAAFAVLAAFRPGADVSNRAWVDTSATTQVAAAARNAIQTLYTYKFDTVDQDFDNARAVLTDDMRAQFDQTAQVTRDAVIQTKTATEAQVTDIGVKLLSDDRAELVASMNVSASNDGVAQGSAAGPLSVTMSKVGDTWLLSDIRDR